MRVQNVFTGQGVRRVAIPVLGPALVAVAIHAPAFAQRADVRVSTPVTVITSADLEKVPSCGRVLADLVVPPTPALHATSGTLQLTRPAPSDQAAAPAPASSLLDGVTLRFGNGTSQAAGDLFCVDDVEILRQPLTFYQGDSVAGVITLVKRPVPNLPVFTPPAGGESSYYMSPMLLPGEVQVIRGPFSGPATVDVNGTPGVVVAGTPSSLYWMLPSAAPTGNVTVTVSNGTRGATFSQYVLGLSMSAGQLDLMRGQSTTLQVTVTGPDTMPASAWTAGQPSDIVDLKKVKELFGNVKIPKPGEPAILLLRIDNMSRDTVSMSPSKNESFVTQLARDDFSQGPYTYHGRIQSKKPGRFTINGLVVGFFAPVAGTPMK